MVYDRDLKWIQRVVWLLLLINLGSAVAHVIRHDWVHCFAFLVWTFNVWTWRRINQSAQRTRNMARLTDAAVSKVLLGDWIGNDQG